MATKEKKQPNLTQIANLSAGRIGGQIYDETVKALQGPNSVKAYREIADNCSVAGACLLALEVLVRKVKWTIQPGEDTAEAQTRAEFIESQMEDMSQSWPDFMAEILSMLVYGWSYFETVYKIRKGPDQPGQFRSRYSDGLVGWRKFALIPQESLSKWEWDSEGGLHGLWQRQDGSDYKLNRDVLIPIEKSLLFRTKTNRNNPEGRSLLRSAYFPWQFVKRIQEVEGIGIERDLAGMPVAYVPPEIMDPTASAEDQATLAAFKNLVTSIRRNEQEGVVFPIAHDEHNNPLYELKLLATGGMRQFDTSKVIERYERRIAISMLSDIVLMGHEKVGSLALSRDKTSLIGRFIAATTASIAAVLNRYAIPRLYELNGWSTEKPAFFVPGDAENADLKTLSIFIRNLASVGALTPDPKLEAALREFAALPPIDPEYIREPGEMTPDNAVPTEAVNGSPKPPGQSKDKKPIKRVRARKVVLES